MAERGGDEPRVEIWGDRRVLLFAYGKIVTYQDDELLVRGGGMEVCVRGAGLTLTGLSAGELAVAGRIASVEYRRGGGA